jgi:hypothetical protein
MGPLYHLRQAMSEGGFLNVEQYWKIARKLTCDEGAEGGTRRQQYKGLDEQEGRELREPKGCGARYESTTKPETVTIRNKDEGR